MSTAGFDTTPAVYQQDQTTNAGVFVRVIASGLPIELLVAAGETVKSFPAAFAIASVIALPHTSSVSGESEPLSLKTAKHEIVTRSDV